MDELIDLGDWESLIPWVEDSLRNGDFEMPQAIIPTVIMLDEPVHTEAHPFCSEESCPCHCGDSTFLEYIEEPIYNGLMTPAEGLRLFYDEQV